MIYIFFIDIELENPVKKKERMLRYLNLLCRAIADYGMIAHFVVLTTIIYSR